MCRYIYCQSYLQAETMGLMAEANNLSSQIQALQDRVSSIYHPKQENTVQLKNEQLPSLTVPQHTNSLGDPLTNLQNVSNLPGTLNTTLTNPTNTNQQPQNPMGIDKQ